MQKKFKHRGKEGNFLHHSSSTFFEFSSSLLLEYGRRSVKNKLCLEYPSD